MKFPIDYRLCFARKILFVFSVASFIPVLCLSLFSKFQVSDLIQEEVNTTLVKQAKSYGLLTYGKLSLLSEELDNISNKIDGYLHENIVSTFLSLDFLPIHNLSASGFGKSKNPRLSYFFNDNGEIFFKLEKLHQSSNGSQFILRGTINQHYLFGDDDSNPFSEPLCVISATREVIFCSENVALRSATLNNVAEVVISRERIVDHQFDKKQYKLVSWELFLPTYFQSPTWYFVILKPQSVVLSSIKAFEKVLIPASLLFIIFVSYVVYKISSRLLTPLHKLVRVTKQISKGQYDIELKIESADEFEELGSSFKSMANNLKLNAAKDRVFSNLNKSVLSTLDFHHAITANLAELLKLFEVNWLVISTVKPSKENYADAHCVFVNPNQLGNSYEYYTHKIVERNKFISKCYTLSQNQFREYFGLDSLELNVPFVWVYEIYLDRNLIGCVLLNSENEKPSDRELEVLVELAEHLSIMYTTYLQKFNLNQKANYDDLTKLPNRNNMLEKLGNSWNYAVRQNYNLALLFIDLDNFKNVNDLSGHKTGNEVLILVSQRLQRSIGKIGKLARLSGDEFCVLLESLDPEQVAVNLAEVITQSFKEPFMVNDMSFFLGTSIGIAIGPKDCEGPEHLLEKADLSMFKAKQRGKNQYVVFDETIEKDRSYRLSLEHNLHYALERNEISVLYQPKIDLKTGVLTSAECLARWNQAELGFVRTDYFISLAEESGLINDIGQWILRKSCYQFVDWISKGIDIDSVAVNVSARQLISKQFSNIVKSVLDETKIAPQSLDLEITESAFIHDEALLKNELGKLYDLGVKISIDDFGKEYSSLNYLKKIPFDTLKIDRDFILDLEKHERDQHIVSVIISIGHTLGKKIVAEGIETIEQRDILRALHCDYGQGYLFSQPINEIEFLEFASKYITNGLDTGLLVSQIDK